MPASPTNKQTEPAQLTDSLLGHFSRSTLVTFTIFSAFIVLLLVTVSWLTFPPGLRTIASLLDSAADLGQLVSDSGWIILGFSLSLLAIAVTAVTVVGLRDIKPEETNRRTPIMELADVFLVFAISMNAGLIAAIALATLAQAFQPENNENPGFSVEQLVLLVLSLVSWATIRAAYTRLGLLAVSDKVQFERNVERTRQRLTANTKKLEAIRTRHLTWLVETAEPVQTAKYLKQKAWRAVLFSFFFIVLAAALTAGVSLVAGGGEPSIGRAFRLFGAVFGFAAFQMLVTIAPYIWATQAAKTEESRLSRCAAFAVLGLAFLPFALVLPVTSLLLPFTEATNLPLWVPIMFGTLIVIPTVVSFFWPKRSSWRSVAALSVTKILEGRVELLTRQNELARANLAQHTSEHRDKVGTL